jgi:SAM-dependent methyltransferase
MPSNQRTDRMYQLNLPPDFPLPLMDRMVAGRDTMYLGSDAHYVSVGQSALRIIEAALGRTEPRSILDLPSGFGRVTRVLRARFPQAAITASDLDSDGVEFCAAQFGVRAAHSVSDFNQLQLGECYDLIWVGSLITHLRARKTHEFFAAMVRHMTPLSTLVVSSHGPSIIPRLRKQAYGFPPEAAAELIAQYEQTGYGYRDYGDSEREVRASLTNEQDRTPARPRPAMPVFKAPTATTSLCWTMMTNGRNRNSKPRCGS